MFAWLRAPGAGADEWLAVDSYYPRARLVVICRAQPRAARLAVPRARAGARARPVDARPGGARKRPRRREEDARGQVLRPRARAARARRRASGAAASAATAAHRPAPRAWRPRRAGAAIAARRQWTPVKVERTPVPRGFVQGFGVLAGLAFTALLIVEVYLGVIVVAFNGGRLVLGLAILLEALSRALGTAAAERAGRRGWAFACAIGGAVVVAWVALAAPARGASTSSRRRWPACSRCSPARSRSSASSSVAEEPAATLSAGGSRARRRGLLPRPPVVALDARVLRAGTAGGDRRRRDRRRRHADRERRRAVRLGRRSRARDLRDRAGVGADQADQHDLHDHQPALDDPVRAALARDARDAARARPERQLAPAAARARPQGRHRRFRHRRQRRHTTSGSAASTTRRRSFARSTRRCTSCG